MHVILLKSVRGEGDASDPYMVALQNKFAGCEVTLLETLQFQYQPAVAKATFTPDWQEHYSGIVFTSPRALVAYSQAGLVGSTDTLCFCVGQATAEMATQCGFQPLGADSGNADALADFILANYAEKLKDQNPLLFLCGRLRRDTLPAKLQAAGIQVKDVVVYSTIEDPNVEIHVQNALKKDPKPDVIVFFSPSGVNSAKDSLQKASDEEREKLKIVAMGPATANRLKECGLPVHKEATSPKPDALVECVQSLQ